MLQSRVTPSVRQRTKSTKRPTSAGQRCPFQFKVFFNLALKRWYFPRLARGSCAHKGHCQVRSDEVRVRSSVIGEDSLELIIQQLQHNIPIACIQALLLERTDTNLSRGQVNALRLTQDQVNVLRGVSVVGGGSDTPAERLLLHLQSTSGLSYIALTGEMDQAGLITFRQTRKTIHQTSTYSEIVDGLVSSVDEDTPQSYTQRMIKALSLEDGQKILLAVAWVTAEARRYFQMFPEACGVDVTNGTNSEQRPNARGTILTSNNKNVPFWNSFLPSESGWVWKWVIIDGFRALLPKSALDRMNIMITDEDPKCYHQIGAAKQLKVLPKVVHRLCAWHKVNRNYTMKARSRAVTDTDKQFVRVVEKWLYSFSQSNIESIEEEKSSSEAFEDYLSHSGVTQALKLFTQEYWIKVRQSFGPWRFGHLRFGHLRFGHLHFGHLHFGHLRFGHLHFGHLFTNSNDGIARLQ